MIRQILGSLAETPSRTEKINILRAHRQNELLRDVLQYAFNPFNTYGIKKIPTYTPSTAPTALTVSYLYDILSPLMNRTVTGHAATRHLWQSLESLSDDDAYVLTCIIAKDLRCGIAAKTVNAVFGKNFIPEYPVMLASSFDDIDPTQLSWPMLGQLKSDGMRFNAIVQNGKVTLFSRAGQEIDIHGALDPYFVRLPDGFMYDGELIVVVHDGNILPRAKGNGILNKAIRGTISAGEASLIRAVLWDKVPLDDFRVGISAQAYTHRIATLRHDITAATMSTDGTVDQQFPITVSTTWTLNSPEEAYTLCEQMIRLGEEGIILKGMQSPWENKRSKHMLKMKDVREADLRCVGWVEGTGKYQGMLGALVVQTDDGSVKTDLGTGFTDEDRASIKPDDVVGKIISVKYNAVISKKGSPVRSLFLPRFVEIRHDKTDADVL